ncbi:MAG: class I SAM-dependent methyltransferase [Patescibacteria group bacterium]
MELNFSKQKKIIKENFDLKSEKKILDIGCGTGEFAGLFTKMDYCGIDISTKYIKYAAKNNRGNFKVMDATKLEFSDNSFDYVLIVAILHHLDDNDSKRALSEAARVLKPDGKVLIIEDAKIEKLENSIDRFIQRYDKGAFIRTPEQYKNMATDFFIVNFERSFRSGCFVYHSLALKNN